MQQDSTPEQFRRMALVSLGAGVFIAVAIPWMMLAYGPDAELGATAIAFLSATGVIGGVMLAIASVLMAAIFSSHAERPSAQGPARGPSANGAARQNARTATGSMWARRF